MVTRRGSGCRRRGLPNCAACFVMEFSHYEPVPPQVQQQIASAYKPKAEEE